VSRPWEDPRVVAGLTRQFRARSQALSGGASGIGWKVGFGAPASLQLMGITAPLLGYLTDRTVLASGAKVSVARWARGVVEFEVAAYMGSDLVAGATVEQARRAVASLGPAIELADIHLPVGPEAVADIVASNIFHQGVVFGETDPGRSGIDISGLTARILVDGVEFAITRDLEALTGPYPEVVATVAGTLAANGEMLRAGDVIITGSVIPPVPIGEGSEFTFVLEPFSPISVRVTG